jgi:hypothetical protein
MIAYDKDETYLFPGRRIVDARAVADKAACETKR